MKNNNTKEENRKRKKVGEQDSIAYIVSFFLGIYYMQKYAAHRITVIFIGQFMLVLILMLVALQQGVPRIVLHICRPSVRNRGRQRDRTTISTQSAFLSRSLYPSQR